jgi:hypothetical protein
MRKLILIAIAILLPTLARAQGLPDKPERADPVIDREFMAETAGAAIGWGMDVASTSQVFGACASCFENGNIRHGSRNTAAIAGEGAAIDLGGIILSYEWKKHVHNRFLHPLWRIPLLFIGEQHTAAAIGNWKNLANIESIKREGGKP